MTTRIVRFPVGGGSLLGSVLLIGCASQALDPRPADNFDIATPPRDARVPADGTFLFSDDGPDLATCLPNACGDCLPGCHQVVFGPQDIPFPMPTALGSDDRVRSVEIQDAEIGVDGFLRFSGLGNPRYSVILRGCSSTMAPPPTTWLLVNWATPEGSPAQNPVYASAYAGNSEVVGVTWGSTTNGTDQAPEDLLAEGLRPNGPDQLGNFIKVRLTYGRSSNQPGVVTRMTVTYRCPG